MLNGKFYTGLPPKMIERGGGYNGGAKVNRLESHFFWPDESKIDSAVETRVKRRSSFQLNQSEKPQLHRQTSLDRGGGDDVDTKQMFHKEFAKSSIQFFDNIQEEDEDFKQKNRRLGNTRKPLNQDIALKPTATKPQLPVGEGDANHISAKKKQAFTSKIAFYDFMDEDVNSRNNVRKPKMDMNDKRDVERNSKNSPKLQVKRSINVEGRNDNDPLRDQYTPERSIENDRDSYNRPQRMIRNAVFEEEERQYSPSKNNRRSIEREYHYESPDYIARGSHQLESRRSVITPRNEYSPKRILKNSVREQNNNYHDYIECRNDGGEYSDGIQYIENNMRNARIRTSPKKHVTYEDEMYEDEAPVRYTEQNHVNARSNQTNSRTSTAYNARLKMPNMKTGNNHHQPLPINSNATDYDHDYNYSDQYQYMETGSDFVSKNSLKPNNNRNNHYKLNNQPQISQKIIPKMSTTTTTNADVRPQTPTETTAPPHADAKKHLRSSICFYDGVIIANNNNNNSNNKNPTTPTSINSNNRRSARNSATRRVSVGLPD